MMPTISRFRQLNISLYFEAHNPPHFHVQFGKTTTLHLLDGTLLMGELEALKQKEIREWAALQCSPESWTSASDVQAACCWGGVHRVR
jgi:hypothetical protein